jgi:hypothetical protein
VQLPWQEAEHFASQLADGAVAMQLALQRVLQLAWQDVMHSDMFESLAHSLVQPPSQLPVQSALQSNDPGSAVQPPMQVASQEPLQPTSTSALHPPVHDSSSDAEQASWNLSGVQSAVQPPLVSSVQLVLAASRKMSPHDDKLSARASRPGKKTTTKAASARANEANRVSAASAEESGRRVWRVQGMARLL